MSVPTTTTSWRKAYRIISSRYPPVGVFDEVADPADLDAVFYVESLTNPRLRAEAGQIELVAIEDRIAGPGTTPIMSAFTHLNPSGSRFTNGDYGVYYAAHSQQTAIAETVFHVERWALESHDPPTSFVMRVYIGALLKHAYHDLRDKTPDFPQFFHPDPAHYGPAQAFAAQLRANHSLGLLYDSVRHPGGQCVAVFKPRALGAVHQAAHLAYCWDGQRITDVLHLRSLGLPG